MSHQTWRQQAAPIIAEVIERVGREDMKALKRELRAAYPFGKRQYYPYKAWLLEVATQLGTRKRKKTTSATRHDVANGVQFESIPGQLPLF